MMVCAVIAAAVAAGDVTPSIIEAGGSVDHAWYVIETAPSTWSLFVGQLTGADPTMAAVRDLTHVPDAIAGAGDRLWLLHGGDGVAAAELFTVQAIYNPLLESWYAVPASHLEAVPAPPTSEPIIALCADEYGPVIVTSGVEGPSVWAMSGQTWSGGEEIGESGDDSTERAVFWGGGDEVLAGSIAHEAMTIFQWTARAPSWQARVVAAPSGTLHKVIMVQSAITTITTVGDEVHVGVVQGDRILPVATVKAPDAPWWAMGGPGVIALTWMGDQGRPLVQRITIPTGAVAEPQELSAVQPNSSAVAIWQMVMVAVMGLSIIVVMAMGRRVAHLGPSSKDLVIASPMARLIAVGIDLIPGAAVAMLTVSLSPLTIVRGGLGVTTVDHAIELTIVITVTTIWCAAWEAATGTTPGKRIVGLQVRMLGGNRPNVAAVLIRNAFKAIVLFVPPLAILMLLNPRQQGLGDIASGTIVVKRRSASHATS